MREWTIEVYILDQDGKEHPAKCFQKAVYNLHPSFEVPVQSECCPGVGGERSPRRLHRIC